MYKKAQQLNLMSPLAALKLMEYQIWIPPAVIQSSVTVDGKQRNLKRMNEARFKTRNEFWWKSVVQHFNQGTAEANHRMVEDLCRNLRWVTMMNRKGETVHGLSFMTSFYRQNYDLCWSFYDALKVRVAVSGKRWGFHHCVDYDSEGYEVARAAVFTS